MGKGAWWAAVRGVVKSRTRLSDFTFIFHFLALEKEMATHSSYRLNLVLFSKAAFLLPSFLEETLESVSLSLFSKDRASLLFG